MVTGFHIQDPLINVRNTNGFLERGFSYVRNPELDILVCLSTWKSNKKYMHLFLCLSNLFNCQSIFVLAIFWLSTWDNETLIFVQFQCHYTIKSPQNRIIKLFSNIINHIVVRTVHSFISMILPGENSNYINWFAFSDLKNVKHLQKLLIYNQIHPKVSSKSLKYKILNQTFICMDTWVSFIYI